MGQKGEVILYERGGGGYVLGSRNNPSRVSSWVQEGGVDVTVSTVWVAYIQQTFISHTSGG